MRAHEFINEVGAAGSFDDSKVNLEWLYGETVTGSTKVADVRDNAQLVRKGQWYSLVKNDLLIGCVKLVNEKLTTINKTYSNVAAIYIVPEYRKTSAIKWLLFAIKEYSEFPVMVDGSVFDDGISLLLSIIKHQQFNVKVLDKTTGAITPFVSLINDRNSCYLLESIGIGCAKIFESDCGQEPMPIWFTFIDDF